MSSLLPRSLTRPDKTKKEPVLVTLRQLNKTQWALVLSCWLARVCDGANFYSVPFSITRLTEEFGKTTTELTASITLTLLLRALGAFVFGVGADRYGRKWPLVCNLFLCSTLQLGSGFAQTYRQFLVLRALFGITMGGIWGSAASTALENVPPAARGVVSGILQQGYAIGSLIAAAINLGLVPRTRYTWRILFWFGAAMTFVATIFRVCLPETQVFLRARAARAEAKRSGGNEVNANKTRKFLLDAKEMLKHHWLRFIYATILATAVNFLSHGINDLYPTLLQRNKLLSTRKTAVVTMLGNAGACRGAVVAGCISQHLGRRLTMMFFVCVTGAFIPLWLLPSRPTELAVGAFCLQFGSQGVGGVLPIFLAEMSPPAFRATFPGLAYQLGTMAPSASAQIESVGGSHCKTIVQGRFVPNYVKASGIFVGVTTVCLTITIFFGPENHGSEFEKRETMLEDGRGQYSVSVQREVLPATCPDEGFRGQDQTPTESYDIEESSKSISQ